jgi:outer membrane protein assembly factor BamB
LKSLEKRSQFNLSKAILSGYSLADLSLSPDGFSINGFNQPDSISVLNTLSSQKAQPCDFLSVLPFNTIAFKAFGFHDFNGWRSKLKTRPSSFWKSVNDSAMFNAEKEFYANINSKIIELSMKYQGIQCKALVVEVKDTAKAAELLTYLSDSIVVLQGMKTGILKKDSSDLIKTCFGNAFDVKGDVGFVYGSYLFFCEQALSGYYVSSLINSSSILQNKIFGAYAKENLGLNFNYIFYSALNKDHERPVEVFSFLKQDDLKHFDKFTDFSISLSNYKNMLQFRINLKYQQEPENKEVPGLWTFEADTVIDRCAAIFKNHKTGENEIAFCDGKNNFYLLNATGNMLWKTPLAEPVISDIYTVDAFKNNKYQLLFSTKNYLHLLDRNGKYVEGFPVKLPAVATSPLTVFDYDGTKDYRLFIACADKKIYNYSVTGSKNEKFTPVITDDVVTLQLKYMKVAGSDYLVTADTEGKIYVFSRRGEGRIDFRNRMIQGCRSFFAEASGSLQNSKLIYFDDKNSLLESISLSDKKDVVKLNSDFEQALCYFDLVDDDKKTDAIIIDNDLLKCYTLDGMELFNYSSEGGFKDVSYFYDSEGAYFVINTAEEVQILDASNKKISKKFRATGLPLVSNLFNDGKKYVLVADHNVLKCVLVR